MAERLTHHITNKDPLVQIDTAQGTRKLYEYRAHSTPKFCALEPDWELVNVFEKPRESAPPSYIFVFRKPYWEKL